MSDLGKFRDHCAAMSTADHKPECRGQMPIRWGWAREIHPDPNCPGCVSDGDRALFAQMAAEVDEYRTPQVDLFGALIDEPMTTEDA